MLQLHCYQISFVATLLQFRINKSWSMSLQSRSHSKLIKAGTNKPALSYMVKKWQAFIEQQKQETKMNQLDSYLQSNIPPINASFSPKIKHILSHNIVSKTRDNQIARSKHVTRNKKKTLFIEDFDDKDIRNSAHSLEMTKNKSAVSCKNSKAVTPERISIHKLPQSLHNEQNRRHQSLPSQMQQGQTIMHNEFIKRILKKFHKHTQAYDSHCVSFIKGSACPEFVRYGQAQSVKFQAQNAFASKKSASPLSMKIRRKMKHKLNQSELGHLEMSKKASIEISPWQIPQEQS